MILTKTITKMFPTENLVGMHLKLEDDGMVVIDRDFSEQFITGDGVTNKIRDSIGKKMQAAVDEYKRRKARFDAPAYETARTQIDNAITL